MTMKIKSRVKTKLYQIRIDAYIDGGTGRTARKLLGMRFPHRFCAAHDSDNGYVIVELAAFGPHGCWSDEKEAQYERECAEVADASDMIREALDAEFGRKSLYLSVRDWHGDAPDGLQWLNSSGWPSATGKKPVVEIPAWVS